MNDQERIKSLEEAVRLLCNWNGGGARAISPERGGSVIALGIRDILDGKPNSERAEHARRLVRDKVEAEQRRGLDAYVRKYT